MDYYYFDYKIYKLVSRIIKIEFRNILYNLKKNELIIYEEDS